jgi:hypothetical protein
VNESCPFRSTLARGYLEEYEDEIEDRLNDLHSRVHRGAANAPLRKSNAAPRSSLEKSCSVQRSSPAWNHRIDSWPCIILVISPLDCRATMRWQDELREGGEGVGAIRKRW